ncbi:MAG: hypothetical protein B6I38_06380 [Anaerolineaceae bacterium 4572_5.1]|nr:MAG: hypothetical protein B6I38_06380 [Anaerolineaceae bacterium 4572_5.1]
MMLFILSLEYKKITIGALISSSQRKPLNISFKFWGAAGKAMFSPIIYMYIESVQFVLVYEFKDICWFERSVRQVVYKGISMRMQANTVNAVT